MTVATANPTLINSLRHGLSSASDAQLGQVVAMVDAMVERGAVDTLLTPLRPRIARLRPARPLRFARLLFLPLDPLIVPPQHWQAGALTIPRSALVPLAEQVRAALGAEAVAIDALIAGRHMSDHATIRAASAMLWRPAGEFLAGAPCPPGWTDTGLPAAAHPGIAQTTAIALRLASQVDALARGEHTPAEPPNVVLEQILDTAQATGPAGWRTAAILLLLRLPRKQEVLRALNTTIRQSNPAIRVATDQAIEAVLDILEQQNRGSAKSLADNVAGLDGVIALLNGIVADGAGPARGQRVQSLRMRLDATCQAQLRQGLSDHLLTPLDSLAASKDDEAAMTGQLLTIENAARSLRALELAGQRLGKPEAYASLLREAADQIQAGMPDDALAPVDRARLIELLVGPDAALESLARARRQRAA